MKKILYLDNNNNFYLFLEIARVSKNSWLFIIFDKNKVCFLDKYKIDYVLFDKYKYKSNNYEVSSYNELTSIAIKRDRVLKCFPKEWARRILHKHLNFYMGVVSDYSPDLVLGEISWANEFVFFHLLKDKGIKYRHLLNLPLKSNRIVAFDAEHSYESIKESEMTNSDIEMSYYTISNRVKDYKYNKNIYAVLKNMFDLPSQIKDYRLNALYWKGNLFIKMIYSLIDKILDKLLFKTVQQVKKESKPNTKYIYFSLHIQPESTPDYVSPKFASQLSLIKEIAKRLDSNEILLVKDHPNKVSIRNIMDLMKISFSENIIFLKRKESAFDCINLSSMVCSVAGTVTLEAVSANKPAIVFSNIFYNISDNVESVDSLEQFIEKKTILLEKTKIINDLDHKLKHIGTPGFVHDPVLFPEVLDENNIRAINFVIDEL